ncbi:MAG: GDP-mannose 4,6-dehydratase [Ancalomicrobiaceae bacterium]|nr:GDP-mannose 4,6-dehydratase [Ancalomicrobiaceae bacterium]
MSRFERILVTGASGFVGGYLRRRLAAELPHAQQFLLRRPEPDACAGTDWLEADIADADTVADVVRAVRPDLVVHLAAQSSVGGANSPEAAAATWTINVGGAIALAGAIARFAPEATVLNVSSSEVYGASFLEGTVAEETPLRPMGVYGRTKVAAEQVFGDILPASTQLITVRPFNHTGPGQDERFVVPSFVAQLVRAAASPTKRIVSVGNLDAKREFLDVRDVVSAYVGLIAHAEDLPMRAVFNIASGNVVAVSSVLDELIALSGADVEVRQDPTRLRASDIPCAAGDAAAIAAAIGWKPEIGLKQMLTDIWRAKADH